MGKKRVILSVAEPVQFGSKLDLTYWDEEEREAWRFPSISCFCESLLVV